MTATGSTGWLGQGATDTVGSPIELLNTMMNSRMDLLNRPAELTDALAQLGMVWSVIFVIVGAICVLNGYRWHKTVILVLSSLTGIATGLLLGPRLGVGEVIAACSLALLFAVVAWPVMKFTVAVFAGLAGAFCGANVWSALGYEQSQHYVGAIVGLLVLGMLAFIAFRLVIIMFTAIGGASLLVLGTLAAMLRVEAWNQGIISSLGERPLVVPLIAGVAALMGVVIQQGGGLGGLLDAANRHSAGATKKPATT